MRTNPTRKVNMTYFHTLASGNIATVDDHGKVVAIHNEGNVKTSVPMPAKGTKARTLYDGLNGGSEGPTEHKCDEGCSGTGQYVTGMENGKLVFGEGIHFRCEGKGVLTNCGAASHRAKFSGEYDGSDCRCCDMARNFAYDCWGLRVYA